MVLHTAHMVLLLVACGVIHISAQAHMKSDASDSEQGSITGPAHGRSKRAVSTLTGWFLRQWKRIISDAKLVKTSGFGKTYQKNGDYNTAVADFKSFKPTNVRNTYYKGEIKGHHGWVGDTRVAVREPTERSREVYNINYPYLTVMYDKDAKVSTRFIEYIGKKESTVH